MLAFPNCIRALHQSARSVSTSQTLHQYVRQEEQSFSSSTGHHALKKLDVKVNELYHLH